MSQLLLSILWNPKEVGPSASGGVDLLVRTTAGRQSTEASFCDVYVGFQPEVGLR